MIVNKRILTQEEITKIIKRLESLIVTQFGTSPSEAKNLILQNKNLIHADPTQLSDSIFLFNTKYGLKDYQIKQLFFNEPLLFFNKEYVLNREKYFSDTLYMSPRQFGFVLINNPKAITLPEERIGNYINSYSNLAKLPKSFIKNILTKTTYFCSPNNVIEDIKTKVAVLMELGISYEDISNNPSICGNTMSTLLRKAKLARLSGLKMSDYIDCKYMTSDAKIYARYKAQEFGIIDIPTIYITENDFVSQTDFTTDNLIQTFPLDEDAKLSINADFKTKFPEIDAKIEQLISNVTKANNNTQPFKQPEEKSDPRCSKQDILKVFGIKQIPSDCRILYNSFDSLVFKLKVAKLDNCDMARYIQGAFMNSEEKVYARYMAQHKGLTKIPTIYLSEANYIAQTGLSTQQLQDQFPLNENARTFINTQFAEKFPDIDYAVNFLIDPTSAKINPQPEQQPKQSTKETKEDLSYELKRFMRITRLTQHQMESLADKLKNKKISDVKQLNAIALNLVTLEEFGFSKDEIIANPSVLLVNHDKLVLRIKLSKIHNRTNKQFLSSDYKSSEETVFVRTCGVKIMKLSSSSLVYETEAKFTKNFGASTDELRRYCKLDQNGIDLIDSLFAKSQQESDANEQ